MAHRINRLRRDVIGKFRRSDLECHAQAGPFLNEQVDLVIVSAGRWTRRRGNLSARWLPRQPAWPLIFVGP